MQFSYCPQCRELMIPIGIKEGWDKETKQPAFEIKFRCGICEIDQKKSYFSEDK